MKNIYIKQDGFGIMEVMAAIFIITLGMVGVITLADQNIKTQRINKNTLLASQLAQEGLELVKNTRDQNWRRNLDWKSGSGAGNPDDIIQDGNYALDYSGQMVEVDSISDEGANLKIGSNGLYWHGAGENSIFNRMISVVDNGDSINVSAVVRWPDGANTHEYPLDVILYNWR